MNHYVHSLVSMYEDPGFGLLVALIVEKRHTKSFSDRLNSLGFVFRVIPVGGFPLC
jgi:hypothetical protein